MSHGQGEDPATRHAAQARGEAGVMIGDRATQLPTTSPCLMRFYGQPARSAVPDGVFGGIGGGAPIGVPPPPDPRTPRTPPPSLAVRPEVAHYREIFLRLAGFEGSFQAIFFVHSQD